MTNTVLVWLIITVAASCVAAFFIINYEPPSRRLQVPTQAQAGREAAFAEAEKVRLAEPKTEEQIQREKADAEWHRQRGIERLAKGKAADEREAERQATAVPLVKSMRQVGLLTETDKDLCECRVDLAKWLTLTIQAKRNFVEVMGKELKGCNGFVTVRMSTNDTVVASFSAWSGMKINY